MRSSQNLLKIFAAARLGENAAASDRFAYHRFALGAAAQIAHPVTPLGKRDDRVGRVRAVGFAQSHFREPALSAESLGTSRANCVEPCASVWPDAVVRAAGVACFPTRGVFGAGHAIGLAPGFCAHRPLGVRKFAPQRLDAPRISGPLRTSLQLACG
jgi:hypothetical protein